jgi:hypothetical protein
MLPLSPERRMTGRKPFTPTDEQRRMVKAMAGYGFPHDDISRVVRCSPPTLRKWFRDELDTATIEANARVAQTLYQQATTPGNTALPQTQIVVVRREPGGWQRDVP